MQRAWRSVACWLALPGLLNLLSYVIQDMGGTAHIEPGSPNQSSIKKMYYRLAHRLV